MNINSIGFNNGTITFDDPIAIYYSGQVLSGKIVFETNKPQQYSAINVVYYGGASVNWTEQQSEMYSGVIRYMDVAYKGYEEYFNITQCVSGGSGTSVLPAGHHSIPFSFQIPCNAPSSFKGEKGDVGYKITASLEFPPLLMQHVTKFFDVVAPMDLNMDTIGNVKRPIEIEFEEFYSCCCSSKPITIKINLPVSGFCPGQNIPITIDAQNSSNTEISKIIFQLVMKERYHSRDPVSEYIPPDKVLATMKKGPIMANTKRVHLWEMPVPDFIAPNLGNCNIIDLGYFLKVTIKLSGCNDDLMDESEVYIGLVPLEITTGGSPYVHPMSHSLPKGPLPNIGMFGEKPLEVAYNTGNNRSINHSPYGSNISLSTNPSIGKSRQSLSYPMPTAPYPVEGNPKPYEIGFKI